MKIVKISKLVYLLNGLILHKNECYSAIGLSAKSFPQNVFFGTLNMLTRTSFRTSPSIFTLFLQMSGLGLFVV